MLYCIYSVTDICFLYNFYRTNLTNIELRDQKAKKAEKATPEKRWFAENKATKALVVCKVPAVCLVSTTALPNTLSVTHLSIKNKPDPLFSAFSFGLNCI